MRPGGDLAAAANRHPLPRHGLLLHHERNELSLRAPRLDVAQRLRAGELLVELAAQGEHCRDRIGFGGDVVSVQRKAHLEAKRVARAEAARHGAAREDALPQLGAVVCNREELATVLARVAGAVDHALDAVDLALGERERRGRREAEPLDRARALHGEERVLVRHVADVRSRQLTPLQPAEIGIAVRRVHDQQVAELLEAVGDQVVDDPALLVREQRVLRLAGAEPVQVVRKRCLKQIGRAGTLHFELAHVRDVEDAAIRPDGPDLRNHTLVLHGHLPAREGHEPCAEGDVSPVQRRSLQRLRHAADANEPQKGVAPAVSPRSRSRSDGPGRGANRGG